MSTNGYVVPEVLVSTDWVAEHMHDDGLRLVEVSVDTSAYDSGHIPGGIGWSWKEDTQDTLRRDIPDKTAFEALMGQAGITNDTTVILYGDMNNWFATYALWLMKYYGHADVRLMNGGRHKWIDEGRPLTIDVPQYAQATYQAQSPDTSIRALRDSVLESVGRNGQALVDVRSPEEFSGQLLAPANLPQEGSQRGGHIPGAANIPWSKAVLDDGTFKSAAELKALYQSEGITAGQVYHCLLPHRRTLIAYLVCVALPAGLSQRAQL